MKINKSATFLTLIVFCWTAVAQDRSAGRERVDITLVEVPVTVTDRAGNPIRGLTARNFEIYDEGVRQRVTHFEAVDLGVVAKSPTSAADVSPAVRRNFLLLFDLSHSSPHSLVRAQEAAIDFVDQHLTAVDLAAVGTFSVERGFRLLSAFTTNVETLRAAISTLGAPKFFRAEDPLLFSLDTDVGFSTWSQMSESQRGSLFEEFVVEHQQDIARGAGRLQEDYRRRRVERTIANFGSIAATLDAIRGRKQVILLSEGFDAALVQGNSALQAETEEEALSRIRGEVWKTDNDTRFGSTRDLRGLREMGELFKRNDVVLHAIDIRGLRGEVAAREGRRAASTEGLFLVAEPTGGEVFKNRNELRGNLQRLLAQQEVVYLLGFQTKPSGTPGKFHRLQVKLSDVPGGRVSHRAGYYEAKSAESPIEKTLEAIDFLVSPEPPADVKVQSVAAAFPSRGERAEVPVILEIDGSTLTATAAGEKVDAEIFLYAFGPRQTVEAFSHQKLSLDLTKVRSALASSGVRYYGTLDLPPGEYQLRALVRVDGSSKGGGVYRTLRVPADDERLVLGPFFMGEPGDWLMVRGGERSGYDYPFVIAEESFVPAARPLLRDSAVRLALFTYGIEPEDLAISANVRGENGELWPGAIALLGRTSRDENGAIKLLLQFDPSGLPAGRHDLELTVRSRDGHSQLIRAPFVMRPGAPSNLDAQTQTPQR